jgi:hypothetical protein
LIFVKALSGDTVPIERHDSVRLNLWAIAAVYPAALITKRRFAVHSNETSISRLVANIHEAARAPNAWPELLKSLTDALGIAGAACIIFNKNARSPDWVCFSGLSAELESRYVNHYAVLDPYLPLLNVLPGWTKLSECLPEDVLARSEWYNDFVLACGVRDILGTRLIDTPTHSAIIGLHQQIGRTFADKTESILRSVTGPLGIATLQHMERAFGQTPTDPGAVVEPHGPRYYFHVSNGRRYPDDIGKVFAVRAEAMAHASLLAKELARDGDWEGFAIVVTDDSGSAVAQVPVSA